VRYTAFIIAGFFAGISGGLGALNFEIVMSGVVGVVRSGAYLLFSFLVCATFFFGPIIGAILMVLAFVLLSEYTQAWLLYLGLVFMVMVVYAPGGFASLDHGQPADHQSWRFFSLDRRLCGFVVVRFTDACRRQCFD